MATSKWPFFFVRRLRTTICRDMQRSATLSVRNVPAEKKSRMNKHLIYLLLLCVASCSPKIQTNSTTTSGNPLFPGWYADPEGTIINKTYWIFPTFSAPYNQQVLMDAFSSKDLVTWTKHERIVDTAAIKWAKRAMW